MSYWISLKHGFDTKEMVEKRINPYLVYAADKLALAREFESRGDSEAAEKATRQGVRSLSRVADNPDIWLWEIGYIADLRGSIPYRLTGIALDEMYKYMSGRHVTTKLLSDMYNMMTEDEVYSKYPKGNLLRRRDVHYDFPNRRDE